MAQKPVKTIRLGVIQAAIWENRSRGDEAFYNVSVCRRYRDNDQWKETQSFRHGDLPVVSKAMDFAYGWIWNRQAAADKESNGSA